MASVYSYLVANWPYIAGIAYFLALLGSHLPETSPVHKVAKWLLVGKLVKPPVVPPVP